MSGTERRARERIPVGIEVECYCCNEVRHGKVMNISEKGMYVRIKEMPLFPFDSRLEILIPFQEDVLRVPVSLNRIEMSPDSYDGLGVELLDIPEGYIKLIGSLRK